MTLPNTVERQLMHTRQIECHGYRRDDGLWDIEGHLIDRKTYSYTPLYGRAVSNGEPVHEMRIRLTVDQELFVHDIMAVTEHSPYPVCPIAAHSLSKLRGLQVAAGWFAEIRRRLGGSQGCTHLNELLGPIATTAYQTLTAVRSERPDEYDADGRPKRINSCLAYSEDGDLVGQRWPGFVERSEKK